MKLTLKKLSVHVQSLNQKRLKAIGVLLSALIFVSFLYTRYHQGGPKEFLIENDDQIILTWQNFPKKFPIHAPLFLEFSLKNVKNESIKKAQISVEFTMNHAGMVPLMTSASFDGIKEIYQIKQSLNMHGTWIVILTISLENKPISTKTVSFTTD